MVDELRVNVTEKGGHPTRCQKDLLAEFAMTRARGVALAGPPPPELIAPVDRAALLRAMADDLGWAIKAGRAGYLVLNGMQMPSLRA